MSDIRAKLRQETDDLDLLKDTLAKHSQLTAAMITTLSLFEERLGRLEENMVPVYRQTENLQHQQENVEKTLTKLGNVINFYNVCKEVEPIIHKGPSGNLTAYLDSLARIEAAIKFFETNSPHSNELPNLSCLFETGGDEIDKEFRDLLNRHSKPVPAVIILDLIGADDAGLEKTADDDKLIVEHLPERVVGDLVNISRWLISNKKEDFVSVYTSVRSSVLTRSLQGLNDHHKSLSGSSAAAAQVSSPSAVGARVKDTPTRKTSKMFQQMLLKKTSLKGFDVQAPGHRRTGSLFEVKEDLVLDSDIEGYVTSVSALHKLMQGELQLMQDIIPVAHRKVVFERIVQSSMDAVMLEGETILNRARRNIAKHDFQATIVLFVLLKYLVLVRPEFDLLLEDCKISLRKKMAEMISVLYATISKALEDFMDNIRNDPERQTSKDGTVHELTSNTMVFLEQIIEYVDIVGSVLVNDPIYQGVLINIKTANERNKVAVAAYVVRVLSTLGLTLNNKGEMYSDPYLRAIFRLNNLHYILKTLQRTNLLLVIRSYSGDLEAHYQEQIGDQRSLYSQSWSRVLHYLLEVDRPPPSVVNPYSTMSKMKDKDKQGIKDKFTGFNKELEDMLRIQKGYAVPDPELRASLIGDNMGFIMPKYQAFYDRYITVPFTKNPEKYIKYSPPQVAEVVSGFFDVSA